MEEFPISSRPVPHRSIFRAVGLTFAGQGSLVVLNGMSGIITARLLHPAGKGQLATALTAAGILGLLAELGLKTAIIRAVASGRATWKEGVATALAIYGVLCAVLLPVAMLALRHVHGWFLTAIPLPILYLAFAGVPFGLVLTALNSVMAGAQRQPEVSLTQVLVRLGTLVGFLALLWVPFAGVNGADIGWRVYVAAIAQLIGLVVGIVASLVLLARLPGGPTRVRVDLIPELLRFGRVMYAANLAQSLNYRLDALLVFTFLGKTPAGIYAVAVSIAEMLLYLPDSMAQVLLPTVSGDSTGATPRTARLARMNVFVIAMAGVAIAVVGYPVIRGLLGSGFAPAYPALLVLLPGILAMGQARLLAAELTGRGAPRFVAASAWVALIATVALDLWLIPRPGTWHFLHIPQPGWGILGAATASTVAYTIAMGVLLIFYRRHTGVRLRDLFVVRRGELAEFRQRLRFALRKART